MKEIILYVDDDIQSTYTNSNSNLNLNSYYCRICHEEEEADEIEGCKRLESPCACSGTVKFAHRKCIQRWCDEKGDTTCEICLQRYEPGYTAIPKQSTPIVDEVVTIRESMEDATRREEGEGTLLDSEYLECSSTADRSVSCCRTVALIFTVLLLVRHLHAVVSGGAEQYPFSPVTIILLRACGIIVPMYLMIQTLNAIQRSMRRHHHLHVSSLLVCNDSGCIRAELELIMLKTRLVYVQFILKLNEPRNFKFELGSLWVQAQC